jgi:hypothetical protein
MKTKEELLAMTQDERNEWWAELTAQNEQENARFGVLLDRLEKFLDKSESFPPKLETK